MDILAAQDGDSELTAAAPSGPAEMRFLSEMQHSQRAPNPSWKNLEHLGICHDGASVWRKLTGLWCRGFEPECVHS